jgi:4-hydroxyphenylacetate 3-monooxygenase
MRTGKKFLEDLKYSGTNIWFKGRRINSVLEERELSGLAETIADLYDHLLKPEVKSLVSFEENGQSYNASFLISRNQDDLRRRRCLISEWARRSYGLLGRSPDFVNVNITAWRAASPFFRQFGEWAQDNIEKYYQYVADHDLAVTHSVVNLGNNTPEANLGLRLVKETDSGIIVEGARLMATSATVCNEIAVYPGRISSLKSDRSDFAVSFAIPLNTEGLKLICRENYNPSSSTKNHPLSSRFEEMDTLVIFDKVFVPWDRVFMFGETAQYNQIHVRTNSVVHTAHQGAIKSLAKSDFILGACLVAMESYGKNKMPHVRQAVAEIIIECETIKALLDQAEQQAALDQWNVFSPAPLPLEVARVRFMQFYPRLIEIIKTVGSSSLMLTPDSGHFAGNLDVDLRKYLSGGMEAETQVYINKVLWDLASSSFGSRQEIYERFYAGGLGPSLEFLLDRFPDHRRSEVQAIMDRLMVDLESSDNSHE